MEDAGKVVVIGKALNAAVLNYNHRNSSSGDAPGKGRSNGAVASIGSRPNPFRSHDRAGVDDAGHVLIEIGLGLESRANRAVELGRTHITGRSGHVFVNGVRCK